MTKEDYFRKNFPDYCTKQEGLSPYVDFFDAGVGFGYNKANEWHYVKDELPERLRRLCFHVSFYRGKIFPRRLLLRIKFKANLYRPRQPRLWSRLYPCAKTRHKPRMVSKDKGNYHKRK